MPDDIPSVNYFAHNYQDNNAYDKVMVGKQPYQ